MEHLNWNKQPGDASDVMNPLLISKPTRLYSKCLRRQTVLLEEIIEAAGSVVVSGQLIGRMKEGDGVPAGDSCR